MIGYLIACHQITPVQEGCFGVNMMHHATPQAIVSLEA